MSLTELAAELHMTRRVLLRRLELDPANHDVDAELAPRVEAIYRLVLRGQFEAGSTLSR